MASPWIIAIKISDNFPQIRQIYWSAKKLLVKLVLHLAKTIIGLFREVIRYHRTLLIHNPSNEPLPHDLQRRHFDWWCRKNCTLELKTTAFFSNPQRLPVFLDLFLFTRHVVCGDATMPASTAYDHDPRLLGRSVMDQFDYVMYGKVRLGKVKK